MAINRLFLYLILGIQALAFFLTFSKSAILGLVSAMGYLIYLRKVPRGTDRDNRKKFKIIITAGVAVLLLIIALLWLKFDFYTFIWKSWAERLALLLTAKKMIFANPLFGIGLGQFVITMQGYVKPLLSNWQFQPVHNLFVLILAELGVVGLIVFSLFLWKLFHVEHGSRPRHFNSVPRGTELVHSASRPLFLALIVGFFVIALFDHYLWDIQQGQIMLWLVLGLIASNKE